MIIGVLYNSRLRTVSIREEHPSPRPKRQPRIETPCAFWLKRGLPGNLNHENKKGNRGLLLVRGTVGEGEFHIGRAPCVGVPLVYVRRDLATRKEPHVDGLVRPLGGKPYVSPRTERTSKVKLSYSYKIRGPNKVEGYLKP